MRCIVTYRGGMIDIYAMSQDWRDCHCHTAKLRHQRANQASKIVPRAENSSLCTTLIQWGSRTNRGGICRPRRYRGINGGVGGIPHHPCDGFQIEERQALRTAHHQVEILTT